MNIICVTNRKLCKGDFFEQLKKIASAKPEYIVLREKDLSEEEYKSLALRVLEICRGYGVPLICNTFFKAAEEIGADGIQLPLSVAEGGGYGQFKHFGISVHSKEEAQRAQTLGADYITYGHIFKTDCKKDLAPRGIEALTEVCRAVTIPVYAIGGITPENAGSVINAGASGVCLMSSLMQSDSPEKLIETIIDTATDLY
jgi:thiamine-phosphate pyrophosphorylase